MSGGRWAVISVAIACSMLAAGCGFDVEGKNIPDAPALGCVDLDPSHVIIDVDPDAGIITETTIYEGTPFGIRWFLCYDVNDEYDVDESGEYYTLVEIYRDDELYWEQTFDSPSLIRNSCSYEGFVMEEGLEAGDYTVVVTVDIDREVLECTDLAYLYNNEIRRDFTVEAQPVDDFSSPAPADEDEGDNDPVHTPPLFIYVQPLDDPDPPQASDEFIDGDATADDGTVHDDPNPSDAVPDWNRTENDDEQDDEAVSRETENPDILVSPHDGEEDDGSLSAR